MDLSPGQTLLHYRLAEKLGQGGMGAVWRAVDTSLDREVAIKVLPEAFAADPGRVARFQREAKALAALAHPHVAGIYSVYSSEGVHFLAMELVAGEDLAHRLSRGPVPVDEALEIARQVAEGLEAAHESGIVHRDLKPANIQVGLDGQVKILDFGLAKALGADSSPGEGADLTHSPTVTAFGTVAGVILGTAAYMSPEQARGKAVDRRADIWAFGCVLYEMLTGRVGFRGDTVTDTLAAVVRAEPDWSALPAATPPAVGRLLRRCLDKNPATRLRDIGEARVLLSGGDALPDPGTAGGAQAGPGAKARSGGSLLWPAAAAALALVSLALAILLWQQPAPAPPRPLTFDVSPAAGGILRSMGEVAAPVAVSPDGRMLVMGLMEPGGEHRLWVHSLADGTARPLPGTGGGTRPFWSPDSRSVGFFARGELQRIDVGGGPPRALTRAQSGRGGTWNRDGVIVFAPNFLGPLHRVSAEGGEATPVAGQPAGDFAGSHRYPRFLPDGQHFIYLALGPSGTSGVESDADREVYLGSLDGTPPRRLVQGVSNAEFAAGHILALQGNVLQALPFDAGTLQLSGEPWEVARDVVYDRGYERAIFSVTGDTLAYQTGDSFNRSDLRWFDRQGRELGRLGLNLVQGSPDISPDGRSVAFFSAESGPVDIWIHDVDRDLRSRFTFDAAQQGLPNWSPDGDRLAYSTDIDGRWAVAVKPVAGGEAEIVAAGEVSYHVTGWSPDGRWLVVSTENASGQGDIVALDLASGGKPRVLLDSPFNESFAAVSPDGLWLAYVSNESGREEIYVTSFPEPGRKIQISRAGGTDPRWSADGRSLFYRNLFNVLMETEITSAEGLPEVGATRELFQTYAVADIGARTYAVAPDGERFLINASDADTAGRPLTVRKSWLTSRPRGR